MPNEFDNTDPLQLQTDSTAPLGGGPPQGVEPFQGEFGQEPVNYNLSEMDGYINTLYDLGHGHQSVANLASSRFNRDEVISVVQGNATREREEYEATHKQNLDNLRAHKQELANNAERLRRLSDDGSDEARNAYLTAEDITTSDTEYQDAYHSLNLMEGWLAILHDPNSGDGQIAKVERQIYETTGQYFQGSQTDLERQRLGENPQGSGQTGESPGGYPTVPYTGSGVNAPNPGFLADWAESGINSIWNISNNTATAVTGGHEYSDNEKGELKRMLGEFDKESGDWGSTQLDEIKERVRIATERENEMNALVGFGTKYDPNVKLDREIVYQEAASRDYLTEVYNDVHRDYAEYDGFLEGAGDVTSLILSPFTGWAKDLFYKSRPYIGDLVGLGGKAEEWQKSNKEWERRQSAQSNARQEMWGVDEENRSTSFSELVTDEGLASWETWQKFGTFVHEILPDVVGSVVFMGRGKAAKGLLASVRSSKGALAKAKTIIKHEQTTSGAWLTSMGLRGAGGYYAAVQDRTDLTKGEKLLLATAVGTSEALLERTFRATDRGARRLLHRKPKSVIEAARLRAMEAGRGLKEPSKWDYMGKALLQEPLEEMAQSVVEQNIDRLYLWSQGREFEGEDFNWFEFADAGIGGLLFGGIGARGAYRQWQDHSKVAKGIEEKQQLVKQLKQEINEIGDSNPEMASGLKMELLKAEDALYELHSIGRNFYARMDEGDLKAISGMNQELANIKSKIGEASGQEQRDLQDKFEKLYKRKTELESKYITEEDLSELQDEQPSMEKILGIDELIKTVSKERGEKVAEDLKERYAEAYNEANGAKGEINRLLGLYASKRAEAMAMDPKDPKRAKAIAQSGKYRQEARRVAAQMGITGKDFVDILEDADNGKPMEVNEEMPTSDTTTDSETSEEKGAELKENKIDIAMTGEGDAVDNTDNKLPENIASSINRLNQGWGKILKDGGVGITYHKDMDSFYAMMLAEGGELKDRATLELTDSNGITIGLFVPDGKGSGTIHLNENADEQAVNEEVIHFTLMPIIETNEASRKDLFRQTLELGGMKLEKDKDGNIKVVVDSSATGFSEEARRIIQQRGVTYGETDLKSFEVEIIAGVLSEIAIKPRVFEKWLEKPKNQGRWKRFIASIGRVFSRGSKAPQENIITGLEDIVSLGQKVAIAYKGEKTKVNVEVAETPQEQEQGLRGRSARSMPDAMVFPESQGGFNTNGMQAPIDIDKYDKQGELVQSYKSVPPGVDNLPMGNDEGTVIERPAATQGGSRSARQAPKVQSTFELLKEGNTVYFDKQIWKEDYGRSRLKRSTDMEVKYKDYWHYKNDYARLTGNGASPSRYAKPFVIHNGEKVYIKPPAVRTNKQGEQLDMPVPESESFGQRKSRMVREEKQLNTQLRIQQSDLIKEADELYNNEKLRNNVDFTSFVPDIETDAYGEASVEAKGVDVEGWAMAKQNMLALINSDLTSEDLRALRNRSTLKIQKEEHPEIYNMAGGERQTPGTIDGNETQQGRFAIRGKTSVGKLSAEQMASLMKTQGGELGKLEDFDGAFMFSLGYDSSMILGDDDATGVRSMANTDEIMSNRRATSAVRTQEKILKQIYHDMGRKDQDPLGYVLVAFTTQGKSYIPGNPRVFNETLDLILDKARSNPEIVSDFNKFFIVKKGDSSAEKSMKRRALRVLRGAIGSNSDFGVRLLQESSQTPSKQNKGLVISSLEDLEVAVSALKSETSVGSGIFLEAESTSFKYRNQLIGKLLLSSGIKKHGITTKKEIIEKYADPVFSEAREGAIVAVKKVPYNTIEDENGDAILDPNSIPQIETDMARAFRHAIVSEQAVNEPLVFLEEHYLIGDVLPGIKRSKSAQVSRGGVSGKFKAPAAKPSIELKAGVKEGVVRSARQARSNTSIDPSQWNLNERTYGQGLVDAFKQKLVDKYSNIHNLQESIEESKGGRVNKGQDFKMNEELMYGKAAYDLERLDKKLSEITDLMKDLGVKEETVSEYMYALHAKERNSVIFERDGVSDGSGMTDAEADRILNNISEDQKGKLDKVVEKVREIQQNTRETYLNLGMETKETIDAWEGLFESYIPLQGLSLDDVNDSDSKDPYAGGGMSVTKSMIRRAKGRKSAARNILAQIITQNAQAHIKGRTNEALVSLYELVKNNPNSKVWSVVEEGDLHTNENAVGVRVDGVQKFIKFQDASYAETLRGMNVPVTSMLVKVLRVPGSWLRRSFTTLNPEFVISNFSRDIQAAIFNAAAEAEIKGGILNGTGVVADIIKLTPETLKSLMKGTVGKDMDPRIEKYFEDFQADGGRTGWAYAKDLTEIAKQIEAEAGDKTGAQKILGGVKNFAGFIEGINDAFENSIRLSSYIAARENGVSREKSAQFAKNITVNFNKHGEWGQSLNAVYLFFNASVQGTARLGRSLLGSKAPRPDGVKESWYKRRTNAQKAAAGFGILNSLLTMINIAVADDDEDEVSFYAKIPDYIKERNLIIMLPAGPGSGKDYIKIPMPYGYNVFANVGSASTEVAYGMKEPDEAIMFLFNSFVSSFSPISFGQSEDLGKYALKAIAPTVIKPLVEWGVNETYFGGPVVSEQLPFGTPKPESYMSFRSPDSVKQFFAWMNDATGGTPHRSGKLDFNPDGLWYMFEYYLGGAGQFVTRTGETAVKIGHKLTDGEDLKLSYNDIPFMRKMYGESSKYYDYQLFDKNADEIEISVKELKDPDLTLDHSKYRGVIALNNLRKGSNKQLKNLRAAKREAKNIPGYSERNLRIQELMDKERKILMNFNLQYEKLRTNE
tara:strand:+ start:2184 stop:10550 length:8367 start_codon:yes stop_codon:yes gene_type:complete